MSYIKNIREKRKLKDTIAIITPEASQEVAAMPRPRKPQARMTVSKAGLSRVVREDGDWQLLGGAARCSTCIKEDRRCVVNMPAIDGWREAYESGARIVKHPARTSCQACAGKKKGCDLPMTKEMRAAANEEKIAMMLEAEEKAKEAVEAKAEASSAAPATKRRREVEVEIRVPKKRKTAKAKAKEAKEKTPVMTEEEFRLALLGVLGKIAGHLEVVARVAESSGKVDKGKGKAEEVDDDAASIAIENVYAESAGRSGRTGESGKTGKSEGTDEISQGRNGESKMFLCRYLRIPPSVQDRESCIDAGGLP